MGTPRNASLVFNNPNWKSAISVAVYRYAGTEGPMPQVVHMLFSEDNPEVSTTTVTIVNVQGFMIDKIY